VLRWGLGGFRCGHVERGGGAGEHEQAEAEGLVARKIGGEAMGRAACRTP
jgi:hypothetical protein